MKITMCRPWAARIVMAVTCAMAARSLSLALPRPSRTAEPNAFPAFDPSTPREVPVPPPIEHSGAAAGVSMPAVVSRGTFTSVQVNVNAKGFNILGDAANEPTIAVNMTNPMQMAIAWRQFNTVANNFRQAGMAHTTDFGATWHARVLDPGQFRSDPVLASDRDGNFYFSSLSSTTSVEVFRSSDGGANWSNPVSAFGGDKQWIAVDRTIGIGSGNIYQIWNSQFSCCTDTDFTRSINGGVSFQTPRSMPVPKMKWGTIDVGPDGTVYMAGSNLGGTGHQFVSSSNARNPAVIPTFSISQTINLGGLTRSGVGPNPGGLLGQVCVATDHSGGPTDGNVYILASVDPPGSDPLDVMFIRSSDGGATWSTPVRVNDDLSASYQWFATLAVSPSGRIDAIWNDTRNSPAATHSEVFHAYSIDGGATWSANEPLTPPFNHSLGYPNQNKLGDYYHMVSDATGVHLAYAATFNGEQDVYYLRIMADCNGNGVDDATDIAEGFSQDCTSNFLPDECEPDCNGNQIADSCDILAGTSSDCTANRLPDECEEDCNADGLADSCQIADKSVPDVNHNSVPDECEAVLYVRPGATGLDNGRSWANAYTSLHSALDHAFDSPGVVMEIWVAGGVYKPSFTTDRGKSFRLPSGVAIYGGFSGNETTRDNRNWRRYATILSGDLAGNDQPGQVNRDDNSLHVAMCDGCVNAMLDGFVIIAGNASGVGLDRDGGGLSVSSGTIEIRNCVFRDNLTVNRGGAILASNAVVTLRNCLLANNHAFEGAALFSTRGSRVEFINSTVGHNTASGLSALGGDFSNNTLIVDSSILWGNTDPNEAPEDAQFFGMSHVAVDHSTVEGWSGSYPGMENSAEDPQFVDPDGDDNFPGTGDDNFRLGPNSPAINAGDPNAHTLLYTSDLDGHWRILCGLIDQGAYEFGKGDFNCDRAVGFDDFAAWPNCMTGPDTWHVNQCEALNFDGRNYIDLFDFAIYQTIYGDLP